MPLYTGLVHKDADSTYGVSFPDFPGCISAASSMEELYEMAAEALTLHSEGMRRDGEAIPLATAAASLDSADCHAVIWVPLL